MLRRVQISQLLCLIDCRVQRWFCLPRGSSSRLIARPPVIKRVTFDRNSSLWWDQDVCQGFQSAHPYESSETWDTCTVAGSRLPIKLGFRKHIFFHSRVGPYLVEKVLHEVKHMSPAEGPKAFREIVVSVGITTMPSPGRVLLVAYGENLAFPSLFRYELWAWLLY